MHWAAVAMEDLTIAEMITKKRDGEELTEMQISQFVRAVVKKDLEQSQLGKYTTSQACSPGLQ